ncbi:MAG: ABC transporter ATP-binding protein [Proteobacteria bacterium]|nr:ABC transporter ATP-binding protein [Pseudomonadota bacterium]
MTGSPVGRPAASDRRVILSVIGARKEFAGEAVVDGFDLDVREGEFFSLLGASGCGKTTLLRMIAGLEVPDGGRFVIDGVDMTDAPPYARPVNMVFQSYALFPHMTVEKNIAYGLKNENLTRDARAERIAEALRQVELTGFEGRKPDQLSGGQRQRVALARAIAKRPKILLLDEPLAALNRKLRERTQLELVSLQERLGIAFVMVTHDQEEAMTVSDRIAVMDQGVIRQIGTPRQIYEKPDNRFVADFVGAANLFDGTVVADAEGEVTVRGPALGADIRVLADGGGSLGQAATVMVRPEKIAIARSLAAGGGNQLSGTIKDIGYLGDLSIYHVRLDTGWVVQASMANSRQSTEQPLTWDERVELAWPAGDGVFLTS